MGQAGVNKSMFRSVSGRGWQVRQKEKERETDRENSQKESINLKESEGMYVGEVACVEEREGRMTSLYFNFKT